MKYFLVRAVCALSIVLTSYATSFCQESPVEKALQVPGAKVTIPITAQAQDDVSSYSARHLTELIPMATIRPNGQIDVSN